ncbi:unnamed protein product, partial [Musa acuminata var. zebrina]
IISLRSNLKEKKFSTSSIQKNLLSLPGPSRKYISVRRRGQVEEEGSLKLKR